MSEKLLFIYNPRSGKELLKEHFFDIINIFSRENYEIITLPTFKKGDAKEYVKTKNDFDFILCSGGDGTLNEVVSGMVEANLKVPLGYIPSGSTNDFGNSLGLPKDMILCSEQIIKKNEFECDLGKFNDNIFVYVAAFGIFTRVSYETPQDLKNTFGYSAYLIEGIKSLTNVNNYHLSIKYDDGEIEDDFVFGMITNSLSVGGFKNYLNKDIALNDGYFEVMLVKKPKNPIELNNIILSILNMDTSSNQILTIKTKKLEIKSEYDVSWTLDGENGGNHKNVKIENLNKVLKIYR